MREIIFRGKSPITKEWVYGDLFQHGEQAKAGLEALRKYQQEVRNG